MAVLLKTLPAATATDLVSDYAEYLSRSPLADSSRAAHLQAVTAFATWVESVSDHGSAAFSEPLDREFALRDYLRHLRADLRRSPSTVNGVLAALNSFFVWRGLGPSTAKSARLPRQAPRALSAEEVRRLLRAAERRRSPRDLALLVTMLATGIRRAEVAALDLDDLSLSARKGNLTVRDGKGGKSRLVPVNSQAREALQTWLAKRHTAGTASTAVFVGVSGERLAVRTVDHIVRSLGRDVGVEVSPHRLRHTTATQLVRAGVDLVLVAEVLGHTSLETVRLYSAPSEEDRAAALEGLVLEP
jgi:integrase/recombinase XerC